MPFIKERLSGDPVPDVGDAVRDQTGVLRDPHTGVAARDPAKQQLEGKPEALERRYARLTRGCWLPSEGRERQADLEVFVASGGKELPSRFVDEFGEARDRASGRRLRTMRAEESSGTDEPPQIENWFTRRQRIMNERGRAADREAMYAARRAAAVHKVEYDPFGDSFTGDYDPI